MSEQLRISQRQEGNYENFEAECPWCGEWNIFNRITDLHKTEEIAHQSVTCFDCSQAFVINNDSINAPYEKLIFDCSDLKKRKQYMACILNLAQAHEMFFAQFLRVRLAYMPFAKEDDLDGLNHLLTAIYEATKRDAFGKLRSIFLNEALSTQRVETVNEAKDVIAALNRTTPSDSDIQKHPDPKVSLLLLRLKATDLGELRNKVVHQRGYRPSLQEVEHQLKNVREILFGLSQHLNCRVDDPRWYCKAGC